VQRLCEGDGLHEPGDGDALRAEISPKDVTSAAAARKLRYGRAMCPNGLCGEVVLGETPVTMLKPVQV